MKTVKKIIEQDNVLYNIYFLT